MDDKTILKAMARIERRLATTIAERAAAHPDPSSTRRLRMAWGIAKMRADYFEEMACDKAVDCLDT